MSDRGKTTLAAAALVAVIVPGVLEGGVLPSYLGISTALVVLVAAYALAFAGGAQPGRRLLIPFGLVLLAVTWAVVPVPEALRGLVAPGQAAAISRIFPGGEGDVSSWLDALTRYDVLAAIGSNEPWTGDSLAGATPLYLHPGGSNRGQLWTTLCLWVAMGAAFFVGISLGKERRASNWFAIGFLFYGIAEAVFGIVNRNGGSTGIGTKIAYLGSATGTFINRGHLGALLVLALGLTWGLMASLFPLLPEAARRHAKRSRRSSQPPTVFEASGDKLPRLVLLGFSAALLCVALVATQARAPLTAVGVAALGVGAWVNWRRDEDFHLKIPLAILLAGTALAMATFGVRGALGRFTSAFSADDVSLVARLDLWRAGFWAWLDAPLLGHGPAGWRIAHVLHEKGAHLYENHHAHSEIVEQMVEVGLVGTLGLGALLVFWFRESIHRLDAAPQDERTALAVGGLMGVVAVALQSLFDFPLHTPGVGIPTFLVAGLSLGALGEFPSWRAPKLVVLLAAPALLLAAVVVVRDRSIDASRADHLSDRPPVYYLLTGEKMTMAELLARRDVARREAGDAPLSPWAWISVGISNAILAVAIEKDTPGTDGLHREDAAYAADQALTRAVLLRPADPRVLVAAAEILVRLGRSGLATDAFAARATTLLEKAVQLDSWRAEAVFAAAGTLSEVQIRRIADAAHGDERERARVAYQYGKELERRGQLEAALTVQEQAAGADPSYGPPAFAAGVVARRLGEDDRANAHFAAFLSSRDRPEGMEGWARVFLGDYAAAEVAFRKIIAKNGDNRWAWEGLARVAQERGDATGELNALRKILKMAPDDKNVKRRVADLEAGKKTP